MNLEHLRVIGARAFVHIETYKRTLDPHTWEERLVGHSSNSRIYNPATRRVVESMNVMFLENPADGPQLGLEDDSFFWSFFNHGEEDTTFYGILGTPLCVSISTRRSMCLGV